MGLALSGADAVVVPSTRQRGCAPRGSSEKVLSAPGRTHALPLIHTDRARSGAAQAAQGPRTGLVGRRDPRYRYEAPEVGSKYPTHTAISACATRRNHGWSTSRPTQVSHHSQFSSSIQSVFSRLSHLTYGPSVPLARSLIFNIHGPNTLRELLRTVVLTRKAGGPYGRRHRIETHLFHDITS